MKLVTIGILAYNEERLIADTIASVFSQSVFGSDHSSRYRWQVVVLTNGCTDSTAAVAQTAVAAEQKKLPATIELTAKFVDIPQPGKSNAWNLFVHSIADKETEIFCFIDADIEFINLNTIRSALACFETNADVAVAVSMPLKRFPENSGRRLLKSISARVSKAKLETEPHHGICGQFYCGRASVLRNIWMPVGLSVEDGFLLAMAATDCFRKPPDLTRIVRAPEASHWYEGLTSFPAIMRHEERLVIGMLLNCYLCWDTLTYLTPKSGDGAGKLIEQLNADRPSWYQEMMQNAIAARGSWVIPNALLFRRFEQLKGEYFPKALARLPLVLASTVVDWYVLFRVNRRMVTGRSVGFW
ncbi:MAG: glycosyltransferase [Hyphomicrobium sp.]